MSWRLQIPYRSLEDPLVTVAEAARVLPADESAIVRQLVLGEIAGGQAKTAGELIDKLEKATPAERRKLLDGARVKAGLESASDVEFGEEHRRRQHQASIRAANAPPPQLAYSESGGIVDLAEQEVESKRAEAHEATLLRRREEREAVQTIAAAEAHAHDRAARSAARPANAFPPGDAA